MSFTGIARALPSLAARGPLAIVEFIWSAGVACLSVAAAWSVWMRAPAAVPLARAAIVLSAAAELQRLAWTALPSDVIPGTQKWMAAAVVLIALALMAMTTRLNRGQGA